MGRGAERKIVQNAIFHGGWAGGQRGKLSKNAIFHGKRQDNKISKVKIVLSRDFVVMAQAPSGRAPNCIETQRMKVSQKVTQE